MDWFDCVITGARVVDPANGLDAVRDLGFKDGKVAEIAEGGLASRAWRVYDMEGLIAVPGIIDSHVHMRAVNEEIFCGFTMSALSGVCTALEMWGYSESILNALPRWGCGLNIALLEAGVPGVSLSGPDPSMDELDMFTKSALDNGCFGTKLLGGHYPLKLRPDSSDPPASKAPMWPGMQAPPPQAPTFSACAKPAKLPRAAGFIWPILTATAAGSSTTSWMKLPKR